MSNRESFFGRFALLAVAVAASAAAAAPRFPPSPAAPPSAPRGREPWIERSLPIGRADDAAPAPGATATNFDLLSRMTFAGARWHAIRRDVPGQKVYAGLGKTLVILSTATP